MVKQPPNVNGVMALTDTEIQDIKTTLQSIKDAFVETDDQPTADTFYITATYNRNNPSQPINGDTAEYCLAYDPTGETPQQGV